MSTPSLTFAGLWANVRPSDRARGGNVCHVRMSLRLPGTLTGSQRRVLRSEAGRRSSSGTLVTVTLGENALPETAVRAVDEALKQHELIRVRIRVRKRKEAAEFGKEIAALTDSHVAQVIGHTVLMYRRIDSGSRIKLPSPVEEP